MADGSGILWSYLVVVNQLFPIKGFKGVTVHTSLKERMVAFKHYVPHFPFTSDHFAPLRPAKTADKKPLKLDT